jgi:hypothetical protein
LSEATLGVIPGTKKTINCEVILYNRPYDFGFPLCVYCLMTFTKLNKHHFNIKNLQYAIMDNPDRCLAIRNDPPQKINSYQDYLFFLDADRLSLDLKRKRPQFFGDEIWKFQRALRKVEYYKN